jgi:nucleotide sugar dehydrogenase
MHKIGFIGQGWIGKNYSDDLESRGFPVTRYALEPPYNENREAIKNCDIVFIAVPTPTTAEGFDASIVAACLKLLNPGTTAVIKSTMIPGTTKALQHRFPDLFVFHSPEFLVEATAKHDAANPMRNIIGIPVDNETYREKAEAVLSVLPKAPFNAVMDSSSAELVKYAGNCLLYLKVIFTNILYDLSQSLYLDWKPIKDAIAADPRLGATHLDPMHKSGRGAGGHCFIKDFAAFEEIYRKMVPEDQLGVKMLDAVEKKNVELLTSTNKDLDLLQDCGLI